MRWMVISISLSWTLIACGPGLVDVGSFEDGASCTIDEDCGTPCSEDPKGGVSCADGVCVACDCITSCAVDDCGVVVDGCGGTLYCGACSNDELEPLGGPLPCESDADCPDELVCAPMGRCVQSCTADADCVLPPDAPADLTLVCRDDGYCAPAGGGGCQVDAECGDGTCEGGQCVPPVGECDCAEGDMCTPEGTCVTPPDCDCGEGEVCAPDGACVIPLACDCAEGEVCAPDGSCVPSQTCGACPDGTVCNPVRGMCEPTCSSNEDCVVPPGAPAGLVLVCHPFLSTCVPQ